MTNMLRALMDRVDNIQEQKGNVSREMEILRKNQKEMLEIKSTVSDMTGANISKTKKSKDITD